MLWDMKQEKATEWHSKLVLFTSHYYGVHTTVDKVDATCTTHRVILNENVWQFHCMLQWNPWRLLWFWIFVLSWDNSFKRKFNNIYTHTHTWHPIPGSGVSSGTRLTIAATVWDSQKLATWNWLILQWNYIWIHGSLYLYPCATLVLSFVLFVIHSNMQATNLPFNSQTTITTRTLKWTYTYYESSSKAPHYIHSQDISFPDYTFHKKVLF